MTSAGRSSSSSDANGIWASDSIPRARSTRIPTARSAAWSSSTVLPIPASPTSASVALAPERALASTRSICSRSLLTTEQHAAPTPTPGCDRSRRSAAKTRCPPDASRGRPNRSLARNRTQEGIREHDRAARRGRRRQADAVRIPRGRRGRRHLERGPGRDGRQARAVPGAGRNRRACRPPSSPSEPAPPSVTCASG